MILHKKFITKLHDKIYSINLDSGISVNFNFLQVEKLVYFEYVL